MWSAIQSERLVPPAVKPQQRFRFAWVLSGALAAAAGLVIAVYLSAGGVGTQQALLMDGAPLPNHLGARSVHVFSDKSQVTTGTNASLDVIESSPAAIKLALRRGNAQFSVNPGGGRAWQVTCGGVSVEVVGTVFRVERDNGTVSVSVQRGTVVVRGQTVPDRVQRLEAGDALSIPDASPSDLAPVEQDAAKRKSVESAEPPEPSESSEEPVAGLTAPTQSGPKPGTTTGTPRVDPVAELLDRADALRLAGRPRQASVALEQIVRRHASDSRAALAAYSLARVRLEVLAEPARAAREFERSLQLGLSGPLREAARAGRVVAHGQAGHASRAAAMAEGYLAAYPEGRYREQVEAWR